VLAVLSVKLFVTSIWQLVWETKLSTPMQLSVKLSVANILVTQVLKMETLPIADSSMPHWLLLPTALLFTVHTLHPMEAVLVELLVRTTAICT